MGRAAAKLFALEGATVVVADLNGEAAGAAAEETGHGAWSHACDVSSADALKELFDAIEERHGVLHVMWNHAGIPGATGMDVSEEDWQRAIDVNVKSAWLGTSLAIPLLKKSNGHGSLIYTASTSGLVGSPRAPLYALAKGGVVNLMRSVALLLAKEGIRANAICPGPTDTPMLPQFLGGMSGEVSQAVLDAVPMGRVGKPEEIARAGLFLASDESSFVTGVALPVDGGYTAR